MNNLPLINKKFNFGPVPTENVEVLAYVSHIMDETDFPNITEVKRRVMVTNHFHRINTLTEGIVILYNGNPFNIKMRGKGYYYKKTKNDYER